MAEASHRQNLIIYLIKSGLTPFSQKVSNKSKHIYLLTYHALDKIPLSRMNNMVPLSSEEAT